VIDEVALGQVFLPGFRFSLVSIIPQILSTHFNLNPTLYDNKMGRNLVPVKKEHCSFWYQENIKQKEMLSHASDLLTSSATITCIARIMTRALVGYASRSFVLKSIL
jgi:hypothetical protein